MKLIQALINPLTKKRLYLAALIALMCTAAVWSDEYVLYFHATQSPQFSQQSFEQITATSTGPLYMSGNTIYTPESDIEIVIEFQYPVIVPIITSGVTEPPSITILPKGEVAISPSDTETVKLGNITVNPGLKLDVVYTRYRYRLNAGNIYSISGDNIRVTLNVIRDTEGAQTTFLQ